VWNRRQSERESGQARNHAHSKKSNISHNVHLISFLASPLRQEPERDLSKGYAVRQIRPRGQPRREGHPTASSNCLRL
jgi:hypothetical protein